MSDPVDNQSINERLDRIERQLERLTGTLDQVLPTFGMAMDAADEVATDLQRRGVDIDGRTRHMLQIVEELTRPATLYSLQAVVEALPKLVPVVNLAATFNDTTGMMFDIADAQIAALREQGIDVEQRFGQVLDLLVRLTDPEVHQHLLQLADAAPGLLAATRTGELFGRAVDEVSANPRKALGLWGVIGALSDPEVQRAAGFAVDLARRVGERLPEHYENTPRQLTSTPAK